MTEALPTFRGVLRHARRWSRQSPADAHATSSRRPRASASGGAHFESGTGLRPPAIYASRSKFRVPARGGAPFVRGPGTLATSAVMPWADKFLLELIGRGGFAFGHWLPEKAPRNPHPHISHV